ncbi:putative multidrug export ATP-binding/permease protein [Anaerotignum neopropionicum]|uniref:Putative multidrug export ATP-binding/permease protein n=1 Tax=Anaerotignum neopropionicum TaxID=36847 RepID=A0A136WGS1_9FIRM|nr:ABC transporter ATP-binding protein [Anaerotignum neopropionicum]KXL53539.1 putative multidrug export ATP-binding/permease protein [Anaerotignum neopropionicum]
MELFKKFTKYYKPYRFLFYMDLFCALLVSLIDLSFPLILNILNRGVFLGETENIIKTIGYVGIALLAMYVVRYFAQYFITSWGHIMGARMESDMRRDLFSHLQKLSFSYYDKNNTGDMMSRIVSDLFDISELAHHGPENIFMSVLKLSGAFIILLLLNFKLTLILIGVTLGMILFSFYRNKKMRTIFMDNRLKISSVNSRVQDSLAGVRVVKSFVNEEYENERFEESNRRFLDSKNKSYRAMGGYMAGNSFFQGLFYTIIITVGGILIAKGELVATDLALYVLYVNIYMNPIELLLNFTEQFQKGYAGFRRFTEVLDTEPEIVDALDATDLEQVNGEIEYRDVSFSYEDSVKVLDHISVKIKAGETMALVGPSGGGKTTFCSLLPRFYEVTGGSILIDGRDIRSLTLNSLRSAIGIVQQDVYIFSGSIKDNISYGRLDATDEEIKEAARNANIHEFILSLPEGYDTYVGERGTRLSGGQKQRIAIARVFLKNPKILILDEATSALDNESEKYIQESLERLSQNRTTIVIAHRLSTIRNADEILVLTDEGVAERGKHADLLQIDGIYARYYNMQFEGIEGNINAEHNEWH